MSTQRIFAPFWRRRWLILTTTLTVITGSLVWAQRLPPLYESSLTLVANSKDGTPIPPGQLARIRKELWSKTAIYPIVESDVFSAQRASGISNDKLVEHLKTNIGLTEHPHGTSDVIQLRYYHPTPESAQAIAAMVGQTIETAEAQNTAEGTIPFRVEQQASLSPGRINARMSVVTVFALGGGVLFGLALATVSELFGTLRHLRRREVSSLIT